jgi:ABC-type branched-subunit amino acid transport system substrate-binding protein
MVWRRWTRTACLAAVAAFVFTPAKAQDDFVIGISAGLTGYVATIDRAWADAANLAADIVNKQGGVLGRKIKIVVEDNRSEPQEAVTSYRKMMNSDGAKVFVSGCLSAGNLAAVPIVMRQKAPMILCSIISRDPEQMKWMFSTLPPPAFEVQTRYEYLRDKTKIRKVGIIYDQSPYANLLMKSATDLAEKYGLSVVGSEQYQQTDADLGVVLKKLHASGAEAILKMGVGPTTMTAAKNIKDMALGIPLLTSSEDVAVFGPVSKVLGKDFFFVAGPTQVYDALPDGPTKAAIEKFLTPWRAKYGDRDPTWAGRGYDSVMVVVDAIKRSKSFDTSALRDEIERTNAFSGTSGAYDFGQNHFGITQNPYILAQIVNDKIEIVK